MKNIFLKVTGLFLVSLILVLVGCEKDDLKTLDAEMVTWKNDGITSTSVELSGYVVAEENGFTEYGVVWGTNENPTISDNKKVADKVENAVYWVTVDGLEHLTTYHYRAYVETEDGTVIYGDDDKFTTLAHVATVTIADVATNVTDISADIDANVPYDGKDEVTEKGVVYSTASNPTVDDSKVDGGSGMGEFTASLSGLVANTTYYARAYAINGVGTVYTSEISFKTAIGIATVVTGEATGAATSAIIAGNNVTYNGGADVTERGVCYSTSENPTVDDIVVNASEAGDGEFTVELSELDMNTTYYARAYAINSEGVAYGSDVVFATYPAAMYINGSFTGNPSWSWDDPAVIEMIPVHSNPHLFWKIAWFDANSELKFNSAKAWNGTEFGKVGDASGENGVWNKGGDNIPSGEEGYKMIVVNLLTNTIQITDPVIYAQGSAFGNWNGGEFLFTPDATDAKVLVSPAAVADDNARMYVTATTLTNGDGNVVDWWQAEFNVYTGGIEYRGTGNDQAAAPILTGQKVKLNFSTETGLFE
ncbi:SusF/SusE family outer membrane protein [Saccharicrinis fermentans]|uniref:Outer membrane protein SusF/SusE-like C-terminal domain-containing protein n=1 Tax=Saccharicrinis fermentans DSM 9555 = JCM 21142 TaxID=869213 RepID=W7Y3D4_9BACT|nr:SusF/SusE family outer membrane protein [Saccharicrinis fermentans]GAF02527.1 hypothetical protein JCM21142_31165 [Saccharicrinis fermentans DSM 9555 = JCM 21142]